MAIVGDHPESGVRFSLERAERGGPPWLYEGNAFTPDERFTMTARVEGDGTVIVNAPEAPGELIEKARLLLRALYKQAKNDDYGERAPPRRILRWRGEK